MSNTDIIREAIETIEEGSPTAVYSVTFNRDY